MQWRNYGEAGPAAAGDPGKKGPSQKYIINTCIADPLWVYHKIE